MNKVAFVTLVVLLSGPLAVLRAAETVPPLPGATNVHTIIVVCKMHFDIGYTHRVKSLLDYYRTTMIDRALDLMDAFKELPPEQQFVWTCPGWVLQKVLDDWPGQTPERRARLETGLDLKPA